MKKTFDLGPPSNEAMVRIAAQEAAIQRAAALEAIRVAGLKYETIDGWCFRLFAPVAGGEVLTLEEVIDVCRGYTK